MSLTEFRCTNDRSIAQYACFSFKLYKKCAHNLHFHSLVSISKPRNAQPSSLAWTELTALYPVRNKCNKTAAQLFWLRCLHWLQKACHSFNKTIKTMHLQNPMAFMWRHLRNACLIFISLQVLNWSLVLQEHGLQNEIHAFCVLVSLLHAPSLVLHSTRWGHEIK